MSKQVGYDALARQRNELVTMSEGILHLLGNVKHETETGPRDALCRGGMLDSIREIIEAQLAKHKENQ